MPSRPITDISMGNPKITGAGLPGKRPPRASPGAPKHDALCLGEYPDRGQPSTITGLRFCWCMCSRCFQNTGRTTDGKPTGRCICKFCPCHVHMGV